MLLLPHHYTLEVHKSDTAINYANIDCPTLLPGFLTVCLLIFDNSSVGEHCEQNVDECLSNPCQNNGTCQDSINSYKCLCKPGYAGTAVPSIRPMFIYVCDLSIRSILQAMIAKSMSACATWRTLGNRWNSAWMAANASTVRDITTCACMYLNHYFARIFAGLWFCFLKRCSPGFQGRNCEDDVNECERNPCLNGAICMDFVNDFKCLCTAGELNVLFWFGQNLVLC